MNEFEKFSYWHSTCNLVLKVTIYILYRIVKILKAEKGLYLIVHIHTSQTKLIIQKRNKLPDSCIFFLRSWIWLLTFAFCSAIEGIVAASLSSPFFPQLTMSSFSCNFHQEMHCSGHLHINLKSKFSENSCRCGWLSFIKTFHEVLGHHLYFLFCVKNKKLCSLWLGFFTAKVAETLLIFMCCSQLFSSYIYAEVYNKI